MSNKNKLAFGKMNYLLMIAGLLVIALGYIIMSMDKEEFGFGVLGITVGPIVLTIGFIIQFFAIFYKPKQS
jgi:hypothetical protein